MVPPQVQWSDLASAVHSPAGVVERSFRVDGRYGAVPGTLWLPDGVARPVPLVLLGHGGSGHSRSASIIERARWFAGHAGFAALSIDGPYHGARVGRPVPAHIYQARMVRAGPERVVDRMVADWHMAISAVVAEERVDGDRLGYLGLSMGTRFGVPLAASLGERLRCAVFGKFGLRGAAPLPPELDLTERLERDAGQVRAPVLFHLQWDDELFPRAGQLDLITRLGSRSTRLLVYGGSHRETHASAPVAWRSFVAAQMSAQI